MIRYTYKCPHCGWVFDKRVPLNDRHTASCPKCHKPATLRISAVPRTWRCDKG